MIRYHWVYSEETRDQRWTFLNKFHERITSPEAFLAEHRCMAQIGGHEKHHHARQGGA